jgi:hypothetical protein
VALSTRTIASGASTHPTIRLTFVNNRSRPVTLALEPLGYLFDVAPGQSQAADFAPSGRTSRTWKSR